MRLPSDITPSASTVITENDCTTSALSHYAVPCHACRPACRKPHESHFLRLTLEIRSPGKVHVVDSVHHELCRDHATAEVASVEAADSVLATLDAIEFDVDLPVVVVEGETDMNNVAVLVFALLAHIIFEFLLPIWLDFPVKIPLVYVRERGH